MTRARRAMTCSTDDARDDARDYYRDDARDDASDERAAPTTAQQSRDWTRGAARWISPKKNYTYSKISERWHVRSATRTTTSGRNHRVGRKGSERASEREKKMKKK